MRWPVELHQLVEYELAVARAEAYAAGFLDAVRIMFGTRPGEPLHQAAGRNVRCLDAAERRARADRAEVTP